jgi:hypothetical protein
MFVAVLIVCLFVSPLFGLLLAHTCGISWPWRSRAYTLSYSA